MTPVEVAERKFESAVIDVMNATDSRGLKIRLYRGTSYTAEGFKNALKEITSAPFSADKVKYLNGFDPEVEDQNGEITFAKHVQLLANAYRAALECERAKRVNP